MQYILFTELRHWMNGWGLGASFEDTYTIAHRLIRTHLASPTPEQQTFIEALLAEDTQTDAIYKSMQQQVVAMLSEMLTQEDWRMIASAASQSILARVLSAGQLQTEKAIAS